MIYLSNEPTLFTNGVYMYKKLSLIETRSLVHTQEVWCTVKNKDVLKFLSNLLMMRLKSYNLKISLDVNEQALFFIQENKEKYHFILVTRIA